MVMLTGHVYNSSERFYDQGKFLELGLSRFRIFISIIFDFQQFFFLCIPVSEVL